jgi:hypothetical protein
VAPNPEPNAGDDLDYQDNVALRNSRLILISAALLVAGIILFFVFHSFDQYPTSASRVGTTGTTGLRLHGSHPLYGALSDLGLALVSIGGVGIVYEYFARSAQERVTHSLIMRATHNIGQIAAEQATLAILGDREFVGRVLSDGQRSLLLDRLVLANIGSDEDSARSLAATTASEFAGATRLNDFEAEYKIQRSTNGVEGQPEWHALLLQKFSSNERPKALFRYHFEIFSKLDRLQEDIDPDVFSWKQWLDKAEEGRAAAILDEFAIDSVRVNECELDALTIEQVPADLRREDSDRDRWFYFSYEGAESDKYDFETVFHLPVPQAGHFVYIQPRKLTHGFDAKCSFDSQFFTVAPIEQLRCPNPRIDVYDNLLMIRTNDWIAPSAGAAFVFFRANVNG